MASVIQIHKFLQGKDILFLFMIPKETSTELLHVIKCLNFSWEDE